MDWNEYQKLAMRTSPNGHDRIKNGCMGLIGESGKIIDLLKKHMFQSVPGTPLPIDKLIEEMGDVLWYCAETINGINDLSDLEMLLELVVTRKQSFSRYSHYENYGMTADIEGTATLIVYFAIGAYTAYYVDYDLHRIFGAVHDIYCALLRMCELIGTTIDHVAEANIETLKKRYHDGFGTERKMNRAE